MRSSADIDEALDLFFRSGADSLISVYEAASVHPSIMYYLENGVLRPVLEKSGQLKTRQEFKSVFVRNGALYIAKKSQIMHKKSLVSDNPEAYIMPRERSINIDEPFDLELAEWMMTRHGKA